MPGTMNKEHLRFSSRSSLKRGDGKGAITEPEVSLAERLCRLCHP